MMSILNVILYKYYSSPGEAVLCLAGILARISGFARHIPFLGSAIRNNTVKNVIVFFLCIIIFVHIFNPKDNLSFYDTVNFGLLFTMIPEFFIGYVGGYILGFPFYIAQTVGGLMDVAKGSSSITPGANITQTQSSVTGTIFLNVLTVSVLISPNLLFEILNTIIRSFDVINYHNAYKALSLSKTEILNITDIFNSAMIVSVRLSAPILALSLCSDLSLALINRLMPQSQFTFLSVPIKSSVSMFLISLAWTQIFGELNNLFFDYGQRTLHYFLNFN